jgi:hypothetical protein
MVIWQVEGAVAATWILIGLVFLLIIVFGYIEHKTRMDETPFDARKELNKIINRVYFRLGYGKTDVAELYTKVDKLIYDTTKANLDEMSRLLEEFYKKD